MKTSQMTFVPFISEFEITQNPFTCDPPLVHSSL